MSIVFVTVGHSIVVWLAEEVSVAEAVSMGALEVSDHPRHRNAHIRDTGGICKREASPFVGILLSKDGKSLNKW